MYNKKFFVTGATGSFGKEFVKHILKNYRPKKITLFSRDELKQYNLKNYSFIKNAKSQIRFLLGDVRDKQRLDFAISDKPDYVIHAAALKQVDTAEYNPSEFIKTNIMGAENLISACLKYKIPKVLALSTDKASSPINLYGATKLVSDKLFISANNYSKFTKLAIVRYGNVNFSRGSVMPKLINQSKNNILTLTHPEMTRFSINLNNAILFVTKILNKMKGGEIFVPKLKSYKLTDLAKAVNPNAKIKYIGIRPGEKLHEEMISETESKSTVEFKDSFIIYNQIKKKINNPKISSGYKSNSNKFLKIQELKKILKKEKKNIEVL